MIVLVIVVVIIIALLLIPVGVDAASLENKFTLSAKAGPVKIQVLPKKPKAGGEAKPKKKKKEKPPVGEGEAETKTKKAKKPKQKLTLDDILGIIKLGLDALGRFRRRLSIDALMLHLTTAGPDPYSAVMNYGYFNAAFGALLPALHRAFKVKNEDIGAQIDFEADKLQIEARLALSIRIGQILLVALCAGFGYLKWVLKRRRAWAEARAAKKEINNTTQPEKGI